MEKILINKQEMNAAASKEGSIIDIDTGPTLNTVSGERGKENWEVVWGHMAARVQFGVPLDHFMLTEVVRNLKLTWTQQLDAFEIASSRQWHEETHTAKWLSSHGVEY